jgi:hypothetical protein
VPRRSVASDALVPASRAAKLAVMVTQWFLTLINARASGRSVVFLAADDAGLTTGSAPTANRLGRRKRLLVLSG